MKDKATSPEHQENLCTANCASVTVNGFHIYLDHYYEKPEEYVCVIYKDKESVAAFSGEFQKVMVDIMQVINTPNAEHQEKPFLTEEQIEKLTESKPRHDCELWVEEYFGLSPLIDENEKIDADYGQLVNLCTMVKERLESRLSSLESELKALRDTLHAKDKENNDLKQIVSAYSDVVHMKDAAILAKDKEFEALREERDKLLVLLKKVNTAIQHSNIKETILHAEVRAAIK